MPFFMTMRPPIVSPSCKPATCTPYYDLHVLPSKHLLLVLCWIPTITYKAQHVTLRLLSLIPHSLRAHFACCQMTDQGFKNHSRLPRLSLPFPSALYSCFSVSG